MHRHGHIPPLSPRMSTYVRCVDGDVSTGFGDDGSGGDDTACTYVMMSIAQCVACDHAVETHSYCTSAFTALKCDVYTVQMSVVSRIHPCHTATWRVRAHGYRDVM